MLLLSCWKAPETGMKGSSPQQQSYEATFPNFADSFSTVPITASAAMAGSGDDHGDRSVAPDGSPAPVAVRSGLWAQRPK